LRQYSYAKKLQGKTLSRKKASKNFQLKKDSYKMLVKLTPVPLLLVSSFLHLRLSANSAKNCFRLFTDLRTLRFLNLTKWKDLELK